MSWTYTSDPANSDLDAIRLLIGDTNTSDQQLQDSEINWFDSAHGNIYSAAAAAARTIASKYARLVDKYVGDLRLQYSQRQKAYLALADQLDAQALVTVGASPYLGGNSVSEKETEYEDTSKVQPYFAREQFDNEGITATLPFDTEE